ncbi:MAG: hypothetical protein SX243_16705 [Acidobacteriota bacterium]|nr:hypothetical protein [Acidobacteriota bacterium]
MFAKRLFAQSQFALVFLALCLIVGLAPATSALDLNGFLPAPGEGTVALSYTTESYDEFWRGETKVSNPNVGEVSTDSFSLWATWGLAENLALVGTAAYVDVDSDGLAGFEDNGFQDISALLEYRFASFSQGSARHDFLVAGGIRTPLSSYEGNAPISLGDASTDVLIRLVYHGEVGGLYFSQQLGYDLRGDDVPDGFPLFTEVGYSFGRVTVNGFYSRYLSDDGTDIGEAGFTFPSNEEESERLGAKIYARVTPDLGLFVQGFTTLDGRNTGDASGVSVGGAFSF